MSSPDSSGAVGAVNAVVNAAVGTVNAVSNAAAGTVNAVSNAATNMFSSVSQTANTVAQNVPFLNSLLPSNAPPNPNRPANAPPNANRPANAPPNANKPANNSSGFNLFGTNSRNAPANAAANAAAANANAGSNTSYALYIFIGLVLTFIVLFSFFTEQIKLGYQYMESNIRRVLNMSVPPSVSAAIAPTPAERNPVTVSPEAPQDITPKEASVPHPSQESIVEKILPASGNEVFNVAQNKFTYYDAEPLCNALGAELATYEQVKDAWSNGADWCNYGWVKGQMAVYPTQKESYDRLQMGPADQRNVCGTVGLNGGYFDNPEFKYGVNCYGKKPSQSAHDEAMLMAEGKAPRTPAMLKVDELMAEYKDQADALFVKPFNQSKWVS